MRSTSISELFSSAILIASKTESESGFFSSTPTRVESAARETPVGFWLAGGAGSPLCCALAFELCQQDREKIINKQTKRGCLILPLPKTIFTSKEEKVLLSIKIDPCLFCS